MFTQQVIRQIAGEHLHLVVGILRFNVFQLFLATGDNDELGRLGLLEEIVTDGKADALTYLSVMGFTSQQEGFVIYLGKHLLQ